jgi:hypothetical protein
MGAAWHEGGHDWAAWAACTRGGASQGGACGGMLFDRREGRVSQWRWPTCVRARQLKEAGAGIGMAASNGEQTGDMWWGRTGRSMASAERRTRATGAGATWIRVRTRCGTDRWGRAVHGLWVAGDGSGQHESSPLRKKKDRNGSWNF